MAMPCWGMLSATAFAAGGASLFCAIRGVASMAKPMVAAQSKWLKGQANDVCERFFIIILREIPRPSGRGGIARRASARLVFPVSLLLLLVGLDVIAVAIRSLG